ncbi:DUF4270 domain-containing protein [Faecalibacter rhinopitheci]|uniref:DUF4270 domain-containing protein n=1 Tax=Faecalibacter rhinopitheci TaxID=2779678 RepID=A0A8J7FS61_9FLAO|nr:DUF4270 domain-containing protein [Faecalibacter rhinopitheci]MBF0597718.1 DUF4270 domain-containing protein [Faecalibacter rhinopitheci]
MKKIFNILMTSVLTLAIGSTIVACEDETLGLGSGLVSGDAEGNVTSLDVIAFNTYYDSLRADQKVLQNAILGAYEEPIFGNTKAKLISQFRLTSLSPSFGNNPQTDSVHLFIPVYYNSTKDSVKTDTLNLSKPGVKAEDSDTILIRKTYKVDSIYGNRNASLRLNVRDINTVLYLDSAYYSNPKLRPQDQINTNSTVLGSASIGGKVQNITIKQKVATTNIYEEPVGYKIALDKNYFQDKIIKNEKTGNLDDYASFIRRVIQGFDLSVEENNGFLFTFNPNLMKIRMYYSNDNTTADNKVERKSNNLEFNSNNIWATSGGSNVQINQIENTNKSSLVMNNINNPDRVNGSSRLFLNGSDGTRVNLRFIEDQINDLKSKKASENWTIIGAKLQFHIDEAYNFPKPDYIMGWNNYKKDGKYVNELYSDMLDFYNSYPLNVHFNPIIGDNKYYTLDITKHLKKMVESGEVFEDQEMIVTLGNFLMSPTDASTIFSSSPFYTNRIANPYRIVLHGNATENADKKLKLLVYYTKK